MSAHESLERVEEEVQGSSDRTFGLVFAVVFTLVGAWPWLHDRPARLWAFALAALFLAVSLAAPRVLAPLNRVWTAFGLLLHRVVSPVVAAVLYFVVISPVGMLMRATGKDPLRLRLDRDAESYWIPRDPPGPPPASMSRQF